MACFRVPTDARSLDRLVGIWRQIQARHHPLLEKTASYLVSKVSLRLVLQLR